MSERPPITYPAELPIAQRRDELLEAIAAHQVVIVAGETGSGKSTQLPKLCLELGRGTDGWIGHTQPRRLAARSIAERVAEELDTSLGELVGYTVRFTDQVSKGTAIKLMTDGILLAEMQRDRDLSRYDTLIIDEAHERSLTIDFLLGYLKQLLPRRPDLKVIVTSATIDTARFSEHFDDAPIIEVSGRTFPVEYRYDPIDDDGRDQTEGICDAVVELMQEGPGDILVFCAGERDIREAADALGKLDLRDTEVFPLFARLSAAEQHRVFAKHSGRRIVVATNVAETSLTVPGIRYVVDPGNARISRYSRRTKVQRLPIEPVSQASANQRAGRCGRVGPGICIRLYSEDDYLARPEFTEPEIQRTNLAAVILQMASLGLGSAEDFPFLDPPETRAIRDGIDLLEELDAVNPDREGTKKWLTGTGKRLARLPVDPRFGRMILAADRLGCLHEVMIITAAMSVQDPRERPAEKREAAAEFHARFRDETSDFLSYLRLWDFVQTQRDALSRNQFRKLCRREFLNENRIREWQDIYRQVGRVAKQMKLRVDRNAADDADRHDAIHQALLTGLLSHIGVVDETSKGAAKRHDGRGRRPLIEYRGARGAKFAIAPDSALRANKSGQSSPDWVMAGELIETNRLWARTVTRIQPEWAEEAGEHLAKYSYGEPWWDPERGAASTHERATLYGLPIVARRTVQLGRVDPAMARELFIHHALIEGEWETHQDFIDNNAGVLDEVKSIEARTRARGVGVEYDALFDFYDRRLPDDIVSGGHFNRWWKKTKVDSPRLLHMRVDDLVEVDDDLIDHDAFPTVWSIAGHELALHYEFDETSPTDGVTVQVPVALIGQLDPADFLSNVPGLRDDLVTALIRSLPKPQRKLFVPVPETVGQVLPRLSGDGATLVDELRRELQALAGIVVAPDAFDLDKLPDRLRPTFEVIDPDGEPLAVGKDLENLRSGLEAEVRSALTRSGHAIEQTGLTDWSFGDLPTEVTTEQSGHKISSFPALVDRGDSVAIELFSTAAQQHEQMITGTRRLLRCNVAAPLRRLHDQLDNASMLALSAGPYPAMKDWFEDCIAAGIDHLVDRAGGPAFTERRYRALEKWVRKGLPDVLDEVGAVSAAVLVGAHEVRQALADANADTLGPSVQHMQLHLDALVYPGHVTAVGVERLADVERYVRAIAYRLQKLPERVRQDQELILTFRDLEADYDATVERYGLTPDLAELVWMLEELKVSAFAQPIGARGQVSEKRFRSVLAAAAS